MNFAIVVINVWTQHKYIFPNLFQSEDQAKKKAVELKERCSETRGIKNNDYKILPL